MRDDHRRTPAPRVTGATGRATGRPGLFLAVTLAWTWLLLGIAASTGQPWTAPAALPLYVLATLGPALVASVLVARHGGRRGLARFWGRAVAVHRVPLRWWTVIVALSAGPPLAARLLVAGTSEGLVVEEFVPGFVLVGLLAGLVEEPGWRGYALDGLLARLSPAMAGAVVGIVWSSWHLPLFLVEGTYQHGIGLGTAAFWTFVLGLFVQSFVYAHVYVGAGRSIAAVVALHALGNGAAEALSRCGDPRSHGVGTRRWHAPARRVAGRRTGASPTTREPLHRAGRPDRPPADAVLARQAALMLLDESAA